MQRVPVVIAGATPLAERVAALVEAVRSDLAGCEGFMLEVTDRLGPEPSVLVETRDEVAAVSDAVRSGHAAATAGLTALAADPVELAALLSDRRLGVAGALLPGLPLAATILRHRDAGDPLTDVELSAPDPVTGAAEAVLVTALAGVAFDHRRLRIVPGSDPAGVRTVVLHTATTTVTLHGPTGGDDRVAAALLADVVAFAREGDRPWRAHRRRSLRAS
jgi:hypothetical protein